MLAFKLRHIKLLLVFAFHQTETLSVAHAMLLHEAHLFLDPEITRVMIKHAVASNEGKHMSVLVGEALVPMVLDDIFTEDDAGELASIVVEPYAQRKRGVRFFCNFLSTLEKRIE